MAAVDEYVRKGDAVKFEQALLDCGVPPDHLGIYFVMADRIRAGESRRDEVIQLSNYYYTNYGQVGAMGPNPKATDNDFQQ